MAKAHDHLACRATRGIPERKCKCGTYIGKVMYDRCRACEDLAERTRNAQPTFDLSAYLPAVPWYLASR